MRFFPLIILMIFSVTAQADMILGAQVGKQSLALKQTDNVGNVYESTTESNAGLGLVIGFGQPGGDKRMVVELNRYLIGGEADLRILNLSHSWLLPALVPSAAMKLRPFLGAELGYAWLDVDQQQFFNGGDDNGLVYGVRAGLSLALTERAEIEVGARYGLLGLDAELTGKVPGINSAHFEVESSQGWWIGFNVAL
jgi:hypothetical protein